MNPMLESFISESRDNLEEASQCFLALEQAPDDASIMQNLFRAMHTIKGSSGLFDIGPFTRLMHIAEDLLDSSRAGDIALTSDHIDVLLNAMDQITHWIDELEDQGQLSDHAEQEGAPHMAALLAIMPERALSEDSPKVKTPASQHCRNDVIRGIEKLSQNDRVALFAQQDLLNYVRYLPKSDCFFTGDDPLHTVRLTPGLLQHQILVLEAWPDIAELDPYACNLAFELVSNAEQETLLDHFRYVEDDIQLFAIELPWLVYPEGEFSKDDSLYADILEQLEQLIKQQDWQAIRNLVSPVVELANQSIFQISCLHWIKVLAEKETAEPTLMDALFKAIHTGKFDYDYDDNICEKIDFDAASSDDDSQKVPLEAPLESKLSSAQAKLLTTQIRMLNYATDEDLLGRVDSVKQVLECALTIDKSRLNAAHQECLALKQVDPLLTLLNQLLDNDTAQSDDATSSLAHSENEATLPDDDDDNLDLASMVRAEQSIRLEQQSHSDEVATEASTSPTKSDEMPQTPGSDTIDTLATASTQSKQLMDTPNNVKSSDTNHSQKPQVLKVDQQRIDLLMDLVGELIVAKNSLPYLAKKAEDEYQVRPLAKEIKSQYAVINRLAESMQSTMMQIRMVPVSTIFQRFPRLVRDLSRKLNKDVRLILEGEESEADKNVVENLADPLIHLVRNSLDHGFETEQERLEKGKSAQGSLYLRAIPKDDQVIIEVADDGRGMDPEKLKQSAYNKGIINEQKLETITDQEALYLIFAPGFSTAEQVSDLSGRGVGMDVVNGLVQQAGGKVTIDSESGKGTTIRLFIPLTMAVSRVMMVEVQQQCFGISMENIVETVKVPHDRLLKIKQGEAIVLRDKVIPVISLHSILAIPETDYEEEVPLLIMSLNGEDIALKIDQFHEGIDIVQKPLAGLMAQYNYYSGSALLGDGRVLLILNIKELLSCQ